MPWVTGGGLADSGALAFPAPFEGLRSPSWLWPLSLPLTLPWPLPVPLPTKVVKEAGTGGQRDRGRCPLAEEEAGSAGRLV
eukprot:2048875-Heterocapsa_arctica.AAC.1